jgi:DNA-binding NtrC family response regulator
MTRVLVVDDDAAVRESAVLTLEKAGYKTVQAADANAAQQILREMHVDVVLSDIYMPGDDGLTLLQAITERRDPPRVILMTGRGTIETTALARRIGAFDYLGKPFELSELLARVGAAANKRHHETAVVEPAPPSRMIGSHRSMIEMYKAITRVASISIPF